MVRTDPQAGGTSALSAIIVERGTPGVSYTSISTSGQRLAPNCEIINDRRALSVHTTTTDWSQRLLLADPFSSGRERGGSSPVRAGTQCHRAEEAAVHVKLEKNDEVPPTRFRIDPPGHREPPP